MCWLECLFSSSAIPVKSLRTLKLTQHHYHIAKSCKLEGELVLLPLEISVDFLGLPWIPATIAGVSFSSEFASGFWMGNNKPFDTSG